MANDKKVEEGFIEIPSHVDDHAKPAAKRNCSVVAKKFINASKNFSKVSHEFEESLKKCGETKNEIRSQLVCASCDPTANNSLIGYKRKVEVSPRDMYKIKVNCASSYHTLFTKQRPMFLAALEYIKAVHGKKYKKMKNKFEKLDFFDDADCFSHKQVEAEKKEELEAQKINGEEKLRILAAVQKPKFLTKAEKDDILMKKTAAETAQEKDAVEHMGEISATCQRGLEFISEDLFELKDNYTLEPLKYKALHFIINSLGNDKVLRVWKGIIDKTLIPPKKKSSTPTLKAVPRARKLQTVASKTKKPSPAFGATATSPAPQKSKTGNLTETIQTCPRKIPACGNG